MSGPRFAVVTGCNRGLGREMARRLVQEGFQVALVCRRLKDARTTAAALGVDCCMPIQLDFSLGPAAVKKAASKIAAWLGSSKLTIVINNAGNSHGGWSEESWAESRLVNYQGPINLTESLLPSLSVGASVTMVGSGLGDLPLLSPEFRHLIKNARGIADLNEIASRPISRLCVDCSWVGPYGLSKALLHRATEIFASELDFLNNRIRVNAVCPGWVCTDMGGEQAPISVQEGAEHILGKALPSQADVSGTFVCYCYKNYDEEHTRAWERKHGKWDSVNNEDQEWWEDHPVELEQDSIAGLSNPSGDNNIRRRSKRRRRKET